MNIELKRITRKNITDSPPVKVNRKKVKFHTNTLYEGGKENLPQD